MSPGIDRPGFADPVTQSQRCFRAVLDALARPGAVREAVVALDPPPPLDAATAAVLLTLADHQTPLWLDPVAEAARAWIAFHCGAPAVPHLGTARFALALALPDLSVPDPGSDEAPEDSATVILQVAALGRGEAFRLSGPGLREPSVVAVAGLPPGFAAMWQRNHAQFPRGVDLILCAGNCVAALPRSVTVEEA